MSSALTKPKAKISVRDIALVGVLSALLTVGKLSLRFLANIEVVTLLLMVYTMALGWRRAVLAAIVFSLVEMFLYGINTWVVMYLLIWPALVLITAALCKPLLRLRRWWALALVVAALAGVYGLLFGFLCALVQACFFAGSRGYWAYMLAYWMAGLPFDAAHAAGNVILSLILFTPLLNLLRMIRSKLHLA
ncbi:MAG: hypothetical protein PHD32_08060 [Eubacteriales bacterium]|nr:hypothetical protein [Eubacteriales bacterium]